MRFGSKGASTGQPQRGVAHEHETGCGRARYLGGWSQPQLYIKCDMTSTVASTTPEAAPFNIRAPHHENFFRFNLQHRVS